MLVMAMQGADAGQIERIANTFGVNWPHLGAQMVSFSLVCAVLYVLAYKPILHVLESRRQQIAAGLANADQITRELASIAEQRRDVLLEADAQGKRLIEEARAVAARIATEERRKALAAADLVLVRAREASDVERARMRAEVRHEIGRLVVQTTASVTGKVLTADDHHRLAVETATHLT